MKTIKKIKNLKPIEIDAHFKYLCPNCQNEHWVNLRQVQYSKFVIVCDCNTVLKPKTVDTIKILYQKKTEKVLAHAIDQNLLDACCKNLINYGFGKKEAEKLIKETYNNTGIDDCSYLVKTILSNFGGKHGECNQAN